MADEFPHLDAEARRRLEERGIHVERSYEALLAEVRVSPPPRLLRDLGLAPVVAESEVKGLSRMAWKRAA